MQFIRLTIENEDCILNVDHIIYIHCGTTDESTLYLSNGARFQVKNAQLNDELTRLGLTEVLKP